MYILVSKLSNMRFNNNYYQKIHFIKKIVLTQKFLSKTYYKLDNFLSETLTKIIIFFSSYTKQFQNKL